MLSNEIIKKLNEQVVKEMYASNLYFNMSSWCYTHRYDGAGMFLFEHAKEESSHATKLITYLNETDSLLVLTAIEQPESSFKSLLDVFEKTYEHELKVTKSINELVDLAFNLKDYSTFNPVKIDSLLILRQPVTTANSSVSFVFSADSNRERMKSDIES